jgi:hypothetical protein
MDRSPGAGQAAALVSAPDERALYGLYKAAMAGKTDEWEAQLAADWAKYEKAMLSDGQRIRDGLLADLNRIKTVDKVLQPEDLRTILAVRNRADNTIWDWQNRQMERLRLWPSKRGDTEVFNRLWDTTDSTGQTIIRKARIKIEETAQEAGVDPDDLADDWDGSQVQSWADNIIRAIEQVSYQMSAHVIDATSGMNALEAIEETAEKFVPPAALLELCFTTHPRAAFRSGLGLIGREMEAESYVYYLPPAARADANPFGFGSAQHGKIRTPEQWEGVRQGLDHERPGSYVWTTGFHVGDKGYLLPVPPKYTAGAVAFERRERQKWLERMAARKAG